ncbi:MAG TPA: hypothetical protein VGQ53_15085 [Chitinophagaceae bacterium]|jgi:membrane-bound lytic murein transglycosylase MltF|nr:hypothetical protein [Chitinophagaceae bacterium]
MPQLRDIDTPILLEMLVRHTGMLTELIKGKEFGIEYNTLKNFVKEIQREIETRGRPKVADTIKFLKDKV